MRTDDLLDKRHLQQAGHEYGDVNGIGHLGLEIGKVSAFGGNGPASHFFQLLCSPYNGRKAGGLVFVPDQLLDVYAFYNFILDGKGKGRGVSDIPGKSRIDIVQDHYAKSHAVAGMVFPGINMTDIFVP